MYRDVCPFFDLCEILTFVNFTYGFSQIPKRSKMTQRSNSHYVPLFGVVCHFRVQWRLFLAVPRFPKLNSAPQKNMKIKHFRNPKSFSTSVAVNCDFEGTCALLSIRVKSWPLKISLMVFRKSRNAAKRPRSEIDHYVPLFWAVCHLQVKRRLFLPIPNFAKITENHQKC